MKQEAKDIYKGCSDWFISSQTEILSQWKRVLHFAGADNDVILSVLSWLICRKTYS